MKVSTCPSLHRLGLLLKTALRVRNRFVEVKGGLHVVVMAERDLLRVHHLISRHRRFCPNCKHNEAWRDLPESETPHGSNVIPFTRAS